MQVVQGRVSSFIVHTFYLTMVLLCSSELFYTLLTTVFGMRRNHVPYKSFDRFNFTKGAIATWRLLEEIK